MLVGSLAKPFKILQAECASALQMVDVIIGKVISSMVCLEPFDHTRGSTTRNERASEVALCPLVS